jgi:hypothetical protein
MEQSRPKGGTNMAMEDFDFFAEDEEEVPSDEAETEEKSNRTFIVLVAALGGLLALGVCAFIIWMTVIAPRMRSSVVESNQAIEATNESVAATSTAIAEAAVVAAKTEAAAPTATPRPTNTSIPTASPRPTDTPSDGEDELEAATATPRPTATRRATPTETVSGSEVPDTGIGVLGIGALAVGLLIALLIVGRIRRSV